MKSYRVFNLIILLFYILSSSALPAQNRNQSREIHVGINGCDTNSGTIGKPLKTIQAAACMAQPGDIITVHEGIYREYINPPHGGIAKKPITFRAAKNEKVVIKGSEVIKNWRRVNKDTWMVKIPNPFFGSFNPYTDTIHGDWLERGNWCHSGEVYLNDVPLKECETLDKLLSEDQDKALWHTKVKNDTTYIWANFPNTDPNRTTVEINVRQSIFYPEKPYVNYLHVKGFIMSHAATPWAPPTAEQIGLIGTHWSKGWVIEDNIISSSKCVGITLGKYGDEWDNKSESADAYVKTTERALENNWNRESVGSHLVKNNRISHCGQAGIAGSLGAVFSTVTGNIIHDIGLEQLFWGYEIAGIKFHAPIDMLISHNHIYRTEGGIWLDWMSQGTRITQNLLHDNKLQDLSLEVNHGPILIDNNLFLSKELAQVKLSQGVAFINNIIACKIWPTGKADSRETPYLIPHGTQIAGFQNCPCGDAFYFNNLFTRADLTPYDENILPVKMNGNLFLGEASPSGHEINPQIDSTFDPQIKVTEEADGWYLLINVSENWTKQVKRDLIHTKDLGKAVIPNQSFKRKGIPDVFNVDYNNCKRDKTNHFPGAIEFKKSGMQKIKIF